VLEQDSVTSKLLKQGMPVFLPRLPHIMKQDERKKAQGRPRHQISKKVQAANYNFVTQEQLQKIREIH